MADLQMRIEAHALANALKYEGKAQAGNVLPKIIGEFPETKQDVRSLKARIEEIVSRVNALPLDAQRARLEEIGADLLEKKAVKEKDLPPLPNAVQGKVVTRIPPEPSKYNHLGHAMSFLINYIYAQRYEGKAVLRFEDTNPEKVTQEYVDAMIEDITGYLGITPSEIRYVADDMEALLGYATRLVEMGEAYMCFCDRESMQQLRQEGTQCSCRAKSAAEHLSAWDQFRAGKYVRGECVLRLKGDMQSQNMVMRDPALWRAMDAPHYRLGKKYPIWPLYDFYNPIEDALCGVTHILRSNEFEPRIELQTRIKQLLGLPEQHVLQYGRINITGATTQGREIREAIASGTYIGWDDPRLVTLRALRRRGIRKEAYYELVRKLGLSPYPVSLDFTMLAAANRQLIEPVAHRFSFVADPVEVVVDGVPEHEVELNLHPESRKGGRVLRSSGRYWISPADAERIKGKTVRLMGDLTFKEEGGKGAFLTMEMGKAKQDVVINWLPADEEQTLPVEIMMPDATIVAGRAERTIAQLKVDDVVQFERFGFCRLDAVDGHLRRFWYTHN